MTVELKRGGTFDTTDLFEGWGWLAAALTACRHALVAAPPGVQDACADPDLSDPANWRIEPRQLVLSLLLPGKELREIPLPAEAVSALSAAGRALAGEALGEGMDW